MRNVLIRDEQKRKRLNTSRGPANVKLVTSIEDYKKVVGEEREKIVVARFYAPWCKACRAIQPMYYRLANKFTNVIFVEVPVNEENAALHQGLQVPSLPYCHIYEPSTGLVEELKISRQHIADFANKLQSYVVGSCALENMSTASPFHSDKVDKE
jgi:thiol-disulfide isomerase/thioredoxin